MKSSRKYLASVGSSLVLFTISLSFSLPVKAALPCKGGTISYYQNGSIESCNFDANVDVRAGSFAFPCEPEFLISFDENAKFISCVISAPVTIIKDNAVETCPEKSLVYVSSLNNSNQSVSCHRL